MTVVHSVSPEVWVWAFFGALVSVLSNTPAKGVPAKQWLIDALARLVIRTLIGIAGSACLPVIGLGVIAPQAVATVPGG